MLTVRNAAGLGLSGLFVVFLAVLLVIPYIKKFYPIVSGFANMSCEEGRIPCEEGYFCAQRTCVPILPNYDINKVQPNSSY
jgi:hypothetical protein